MVDSAAGLTLSNCRQGRWARPGQRHSTILRRLHILRFQAVKNIRFMFAFMYNPSPMRTTKIKQLFWLAFYSLPLIAFAAHGTEPRAQFVAPIRLQNSTLPLKVIIHKRQETRPASPTGASVNPAYVPDRRSAAQQVKAYVQAQALEYGVNPKLALWIVKHESEFNPRARGDGEASRGLWQISRIYHPEVSDAAAFNVASSTEWSLERIRSGKVNEWSTYRFCRTLYEDCPF